jgi:hypothetical protein
LDHDAPADQATHQAAYGGGSPSDTSEPKSRKWNTGTAVSESRLYGLDQQERLLAGGLRARWNQRAFHAGLGPGARGAIAERECVGIASGLQRRCHHELIGVVDFETVEVGQKRWRLDSGGPNDQITGDERAARGMHASLIDARDPLGDAHRNAEVSQQLGHRHCDAFLELRQDARRGFDQRQADIPGRLQVLEP